MNILIDRIKKSEFVRNVLVLLTGTTIGQLIPIMISPILTRYYTPDDFGIFALFISLVSILAIIATAKYDLAILLPKKDSDARQLVYFCIIISFIFSLFLFINIIIFYDQLILIKNDLTSYIWLYFVPLGVFLLATYQSLIPYENRNKNYKRISIATIYQNLVAATVNLTTILISVSYLGLVIGKILGVFISSFSLLNYGTNRLLKLHISLNKIKFLLKKYKKFPKFSLPSDFLAVLTNELPVLLFIMLYSGTVVGFYALAMRTVSTPISIIGSSITSVFRREAASQYSNNGNCVNLFVKSFKALVVVSIVPFLLLALYSPDVFAFVFGEQWRIAGEYTRIMTIMFFFKFIVSPLSYMYYIAEKQKEDLYLNIYIIISSFLAIYLGYLIFNDVYFSILFFSINWIFIYIYTGIRSYIFSKGDNFEKNFKANL